MTFSLLYGFVTISMSAGAILIVLLSSRRILKHFDIPPSHIHRLHKWLLCCTCLSPLAFTLTSNDQLTIVSAQYPGQVLESVGTSIAGKNQTSPPPLTWSQAIFAKAMWKHVAQTVAFIFFCGIFFSFARYMAHLCRIHNIIKRAYLVKSLGRVRLLISDELAVPIAYRGLRRAYAIIPQDLLTDHKNYKIAVAHELQHHRQGDTIWSHGIYGLRALFFWNPLIHWMARRLSEIQELACDESLVGHRGINARDYCNCLLAVGKIALGIPRPLAGTVSMASSAAATQLRWRIDRMQRYRYSREFRQWQTRLTWTAATLSALVMGSVSLAAANEIQGKKVNMVEARELVTSHRGDFPLEINEAILAQLNRYVGTVDGRNFVRESLERRAQYEHIFRQKLRQYRSPEELLAVGLVESGYRNAPPHVNPIRAAGVWQFIPRTAQLYGLRVDETIDERMDVTLETDAAMRVLNALFLRFKDWRLALLGYNAGAGKVQQGIDDTGSRDPWVLIDAGFEGDSGYLTKVMAAVIILENRSLID